MRHVSCVPRCIEEDPEMSHLPPPSTGEFTFQRLRAYDNPRVRAVIERLLGPPFGYRLGDRMTGELVTRLVDFVDFRNGRYEASRIRPGQNTQFNTLDQVRGNFFMIEREFSGMGNAPGLIGLDRARNGARVSVVGTSYGRMVYATHTVRPGESLWRIAQRYYGSGRQWRRIFEANRDQIRDPNLIRPGQDLLIPDPTELRL